MSTDTEYHEMQKDLEPAAPLRNECASCGQDAGDGNVCRACVEALGYPVKPALEAMASEAPGDADYEALGYEETEVIDSLQDWYWGPFLTTCQAIGRGMRRR